MPADDRWCILVHWLILRNCLLPVKKFTLLCTFKKGVTWNHIKFSASYSPIWKSGLSQAVHVNRNYFSHSIVVLIYPHAANFCTEAKKGVTSNHIEFSASYSPVWNGHGSGLSQCQQKLFQPSDRRSSSQICPRATNFCTEAPDLSMDQPAVLRSYVKTSCTGVPELFISQPAILKSHNVFTYRSLDFW
jgi:hypothetical protein